MALDTLVSAKVLIKMEDCSHIVVGAGIIGSWAAWHLQKSGCKTVLIDSFPLPHTRGEVTRLKSRRSPKAGFGH